jgi:hypothetical protein
MDNDLADYILNTGTSENTKDFLDKNTSKLIVKYLSSGLTIRRLLKL